MNYIQACFGLPLAIVFSENKADYIQALIDTGEKGDIQIFRNFMARQYAALLSREIERFREMEKPFGGKGFRLLF